MEFLIFTIGVYVLGFAYVALVPLVTKAIKLQKSQWSVSVYRFYHERTYRNRVLIELFVVLCGAGWLWMGLFISPPLLHADDANVFQQLTGDSSRVKKIVATTNSEVSREAQPSESADNNTSTDGARTESKETPSTETQTERSESNRDSESSASQTDTNNIHSKNKHSGTAEAKTDKATPQVQPNDRSDEQKSNWRDLFSDWYTRLDKALEEHKEDNFASYFGSDYFISNGFTAEYKSMPDARSLFFELERNRKNTDGHDYKDGPSENEIIVGTAGTEETNGQNYTIYREDTWQKEDTGWRLLHSFISSSNQ